MIGKDLNDWEEDYFEERAAIMEYDGHLSRYQAERMALEEIERKRRMI